MSRERRAGPSRGGGVYIVVFLVGACVFLLRGPLPAGEARLSFAEEPLRDGRKGAHGGRGCLKSEKPLRFLVQIRFTGVVDSNALP